MLNEQQLALVQAPKGKILCIAGAGSGKTFSIVKKIEYAIQHQKIKPSEILAVTFTKKAANEMKERIAKLIGKHKAQEMFIGTLNSFCYQQILIPDLKYFGFLTNRRPQIFTKGYKPILRGMFPKAPIIQIEIIASKLEYYLSRNIPLSDHEDTYDIGSFKKMTLAMLLEELRKYQFDNQFLTFTDQIVFGYQRLDRDLKFRKHLGSKYKLIIVDEAQDNNYMQNKIVLMLSEVHKNIIAVGDDAQSIYRFRGADPNFFLGLHKKHKFKLFELTTNYRSYQSILDIGNASLASNFEAGVQIKKKLIAARTEEKENEKPNLVVFDDQYEEIDHIISEIKKYGSNYSDIAILCRSVLGNLGRLLQPALRNNKIPYRVVGGRDILESPHVRRMFSVFALACGHTYKEDWIELLQLLPGIGEVKSRSIAEDIPNWNEKKIPTKALNDIKILKQLIQDISKHTKDAKHCYEMFYDWYMDLCEKNDVAFDDMKGIRFILQVIGEALENIQDLEIAVENLKMDETKLEDDDTDTDENVVIISTIHRAKGLEWPFVIIPDCNDSIFPHIRSHPNEEDLQEECRIFHVGVTRAKDKLMLTATCALEDISPYIDLNLVELKNTKTQDEEDEDEDEDEVKVIRKVYSENGAIYSIR